MMTEERKINEDLLTKISGGTEQEIAQLKQAILRNEKLAGDWEIARKAAERMGRKGDEAYMIATILDVNFGEVATLSNTEPNEYGWASEHSEMLRQIREFGK